MFRRVNAIRPPPRNIIRTRRTIGRRVNPNMSRPLITGNSLLARLRLRPTRHVAAGTQHRPHPEEHRVAMRLEGWNESVPGSILRDGRARARPPQDEVRWVSSANLTHLHQVSFVKPS